jgi:hypothetical protein
VPQPAYPPPVPLPPHITALPTPTPQDRPPSRRTNVLAVVALCLALLGVVTCIPAPIGAVLGHVARRQARERDEHGAGMALSAIIVGWIGFAVMVTVVAAYIAFSFYSVRHPGAGSGRHSHFGDVLQPPAHN